jgi:hypothetical protein
VPPTVSITTITVIYTAQISDDLPCLVCGASLGPASASTIMHKTAIRQISGPLAPAAWRCSRRSDAPQSAIDPPQDRNNRQQDEHNYNWGFEHGCALLERTYYQRHYSAERASSRKAAEVSSGGRRDRADQLRTEQPHAHCDPRPLCLSLAAIKLKLFCELPANECARLTRRDDRAAFEYFVLKPNPCADVYGLIPQDRAIQY